MENKMLKNIGLWTLLIFMSACSKTPRYARGEFNAFDKKLKEMTAAIPQRQLAETKADACAMDEIDEERLLAEIRSLENTKLPISKAILNGMDLSKFTPAQANYLEKNKQWLLAKDESFPGCTDLDCIFAKKYSTSPGKLEANLTYYFYLKMGYALSTTLSVPKVLMQPPSFNNRDVLFPLSELKNFYYLTKALPTPFQKMKTLTSIHRMPPRVIHPLAENPRAKLPGATEEDKKPIACGFAGNETDQIGWVILMDGCLTTNPNTLFGGNFYPLVTHEFSHRLDHTLLSNGQNFSESRTWLELSGWELQEGNDASGRPLVKWVRHETSSSGEKSDGFHRKYGEISPLEDFADTVGFMRFNSDQVKAASPRKFAWLTKNIYSGRSYASLGLADNYTMQLADVALKDLPVNIAQCVQNNETYHYILDDEQVVSYKDYDVKLMECIFGGVESSLSNAVRELKKNEPEACSFLSQSETLIRKRTMISIDEFIKKDLNKNVEIGKQLMILSEFTQRLNNDIDSREIFIKCQNPESVPPRGEIEVGPTPLECYSGELEAEFQIIANDYKEKIPGQLAAFESNYLQDNSYLNTKDKVNTLFRDIFAGADLRFKELAKKQWMKCMEADSSEMGIYEAKELTLYPYNGGAQYIRKSLLNCLNFSVENELYSVLDKIGKKIGLTLATPTTKKYVLDMYLINYTSALQEFVNVGKKEEAQKINDKKSETTQKLITDLTSDTSWVGSVSRSERDIYGTCQDKAKESIDKEMEAEQSEEYNFHSPSNLWNESICSNVMNSTKVKKQIEGLYAQEVKKAITKLSALLLDEANETMVSCKKKFSSNNTIIVKSRNLCLTNLLTWNSIVDDTMNRWLKEENIAYITFANSQGRDHLENNKSALKDQAIKKMNALK